MSYDASVKKECQRRCRELQAFLDGAESTLDGTASATYLAALAVFAPQIAAMIATSPADD